MGRKVIGLDEMRSGERAIVVGYGENREVDGRLREVGLTRGVEVRLKRLAPLGDPMEIEVRGYRLAVRKKDARGILVELCQ